MKLRGEGLLLSVALGVCGLAQIAIGQQANSVKQRAASLCHTSDAASAVTLHAQSHSALLSFCDGHLIGGGISGVNSAEPLALASGDFDQDGTPDLVSAYKSGNGGKISVHRGNVAALWSYGAAAGSETPSAFFPEARIFTVPEAPDFVVTGDFDGDGHWDIVTGHRGSDSLYFLRGNGRGGFAAAKRIPVPGNITAMISGEMNRPDGLADIILAVTTSAGARAVVLESPNGAINAQPEIFKLPHPATALALGHFSGNGMLDLAIGSGNQLLLVEGRDRKLSLDANAQSKVAPARIFSQQLSYSITALVTGDFTGTGPAVAALSSDGRVHILEHNANQSALGQKLISDPKYVPTFQVAQPGKGGDPVAVGGHLTPSAANRLAALRAQSNAKSSAWTERGVVELPSGFSQSVPRLVAARVSGSLQDDILAADSGNRQVHVFSTAGTPGPRSLAAKNSAAILPTRPAMKLLSSLEAESAPAAVLPMRLNKHGLAGLVSLHAKQGVPTVTPQDVAATNVFVVTNTSDIASYSDKDAPPAGSLRAAMEEVQNASSNNGGGSYEIDFNIPISDPGYNATDGSFLIQPLSESVPNAFDDFALPPINATVTIDGYTQPGASPNTSATSDNAKILIHIDGAKATTPGGSGLVPFEDSGSVFRGMNFTGWTNPAISGDTASGGMGIEANGVGDFIEGNFFGTDPTGSLSTNLKTSTSYGNRIGVFVDDGPEDTSGGNIIGGTTPQARNILSNNEVGGVLFLSIAFEAQLQGNFIGLDHTGATLLPNIDDGAGSNGPTVVIGGVVPNSGNVISGNGTNIDFNDITNGGAAANSFAWGNLIGTDSAGTAIFNPAGTGVSVTSGANNETIGGTTPAARNVISGNYYGVYIYENANGNIVQGNYIGTDITGSVALGNSQQGYLSGGVTIPAVSEVVGGAVAGAGNVISGNGMDGVLISGTANTSDPDNPVYGGSTVQGNYIGTNAKGTVALGNGATGITVNGNGTNNTIGGTGPGAGNLIANNAGHGILVDPGTTGGQGTNNQTIGNTILSNGGAGVRVNSGTGERISINSIYQNTALGIDIGASGQIANSSCNSTTNGANLLLNAPVLITGGTGSYYISATATDANGNTSDFSNAVPAILSGDQLSLAGTYNGVANSKYTIEFFSSPEKDGSGYGQGKTFLGLTTVTTDGSCNATFGNTPTTTTGADVSVSLTTTVYQLSIGPDFGGQVYTATVSNNGPATATSVKLTDTLPSSLAISNEYCDVGPCQTPITTSLGTCSVSGNTVTCNLGTMAVGATATMNIPVQALAAGSIADTATVSATQTDPNMGNNSSTLTKTSTYPEPFIDTGTSGTVPNIVPSAVLAGSPDTMLTIYGFSFLPSSTVTFNGTPVPVSGFVDNQTCQEYSPEYCAALQIVVPATLLTTAGTPTIEVSNPDPGPGGGSNYPSDASFTIASGCTFTTDGAYAFDFTDQDGTNLIPVTVDVNPSAPTCSWTTSSSVPWIVLLDTHNGYGDNETNIADTGSATGNATAEFAVAANTGADSRTGSITVAGQTFTFTQPGGSSCSESTTPGSQSFPVAGGLGSFATTSGCFGYYVESYAPWITVPESSGLLSNNATANFNVAQNVGGPRTGTIAVGGAVFTVTQAAPSCYYTLDTTSALVAASGSTGTINVTASGSSCSWTAKPSSSQITINSGATGTGNGAVKYTVAPNTGAPVSPTITVGNASAYTVFTANEASPYTCTFSLTPAATHVSSEGISTYFEIYASQPFCRWTATSSDPVNLVVNGSTSGGGTGPIYYRVAQNNTGAPRTLTITAGCQTFTITQDAVSAANPVPAITAISPTTVPAASPNFTLTVTGSNFMQGATISLNGVGIPTTYVSATQVTATVTTSDIAVEGTYNIAVTNPSPGGGTSNTLPLTVTAATNNPVPVISSMFPGSSPLNGSAVTITVEGMNYVSGSTLSFNGKSISTTFASGTVLNGVIPASALTANGTFPVVVTNPAPGGGTSNSADFFVGTGTGTPTITLLQPASIAAGSPAFTLNVIGTNYVNGSVVNFNGKAMTTTQLGGTELSAAIPASAITTQGTVPVTVTNPSGGGTSAAVNFTISSSSNPAPTVTSIQPTSVIAGSGAQALTVNGTNFVSGSVVKVNGSARTTTFGSATQLTAALTAADVASAGSDAITVTNPTPGGGTSNSVNLTVNAAMPTIIQLQPATIAAGSAAFTLTVSGTNFVSGSVVNFAGNAMTTAEVSATQLTAAIPALAVTTQGTVPVTVTNPNGGGTSAAINFTITAASNPVPTLTSIQPTSITAGSGAQTLTITGANFVSKSVVNVNGSARTTTYVSTTKLTAALTATDVASAGSDAITVTNPEPGGGTSGSVSLVVSVATPTITQLQPATIAAGSTAFTLTVTGTNFVSGSVVNFNGAAVTTTKVSTTQLTAAIPASAITTQGTVPVTVTNPNGGGTSAAVNFTITAESNPLPTLTAIQPTTVTAGSGALTLTVTGTNFISSSVVKVNGNARTTTYVSATKLTAALTAADVASAGSNAVTVTNPTPGGGTSNAINLTVSAAAPTITQLQPASISAGSAAFTLTVAGTNFVNGSVVNFNGAAMSTTEVSATQLTAAIPASAITTQGTVPVTVTNPLGGGTSAAVNFTITAVVSNPVPTLTSILPTSVTAGSGAQTLTVTGTNFISSSVVNVNGSARTTTYVSATTLTAALTAADVASAGSDSITVANPAPGGGTTAAVMLTVIAPSVPGVSFDKTSLSFGNESQATTSASQTVNLTNSGTAPLNISGITISGSNPTDFAQTNNCPSSLNAGASCAISVTFTPVSTGSSSATISVGDNASGSPQTVNLSGTGTPPPSFTVTGPTGAQTVQPGGAAQFIITVTANNGAFPGSVALSASGLPPGATASFSPASLSPASSSATSQLSIQTSPSANAASLLDLAWPRILFAIPGIAALLAISRRRKRLFLLILFLLTSFGAVTAMSGCGGGFGVASKTYNITVTGTSGAEQQTTTIQLTVK